ncbi:hypothetical protein [Candidatus Paracaedibacter symbiosus]|uniref:hypothetical protein n=1 Tax=Candidatus Paracaedibacter symbiosus TaxID=244582 RepID=UPI000509B38A|nr:hypothetical protein [Candidatus Paracaedibacter symbiosus]
MKKIIAYALKTIIILLVICQPTFCSTNDESDELVEEGWRLHSTFKIQAKLGEKTFDFDLSEEHFAMAHILRPYPSTDKVGTKGEASDRYLCLFSFNPVYLQDNQLTLGDSVVLTQEIFDHKAQYPQLKGKERVSYNEIGFLSGHCDVDKTRKNESNKISSEYICLISEQQRESVTATPFALKLAQRVHINPDRLRQAINFRYPETTETPPCFAGGNYQKLVEANAVTRINLESLVLARKKILNNIKSSLERGNRYEAGRFIERLNPKTSDRNDDEKIFTEFSSNPKMNSYMCAEQAALDFLEHPEVQQYLMNKVNTSDSVKGVIINVHCSHTPCCSCAAVFAAEIQEGGTLKSIFKNRSIFLICSTQQWYKRPEKVGMIQYNNTKFLHGAKTSHIDLSLSIEEIEENLIRDIESSQNKALEFCIDENKNTPYPIVQLAYNEKSNSFGIKTNKLMIENYVTVFLEKIIRLKNATYLRTFYNLSKVKPSNVFDGTINLTE